MSGTAISALPAAGSVGTSDLIVKDTLGSPNVTQRATVAQLFAALTGQTITGPIAVTNPGTTDSQVTTFAQFNPDAEAIGGMTYPGNVRVQWGTATTVTAMSISSVAVTFKVAFSATPWIVIPTVFVGFGGLVPASVQTTITSASGATFTSFNTVNAAASPIALYWIAIGPT